MAQRLFVALWPPDAVRACLRTAVAQARAEHADLRWQPANRWHLTVAFLGQADAEQAAARLDALAEGDWDPAPIRLAGAGCFGPILWVGVDGGPWLPDLARSVQRALRTEDRRFTPHVTVARGRGRDANRLARAAIPALEPLRSPPWTPHELTLVASITGPHPRYTVLRAWPLQD